MRIALSLIVISAAAIGCVESQMSAAVSESGSAPASAAPVAAAEPVNDYCPIMGGKVTENGGTAVWKGKLIGFCCPGCEPKWEKLSDEEKAAKLAKAGDQTDSGHEHDHGEHEDGEHS